MVRLNFKLFLVLLFVYSNLWATPLHLSDDSKISLITYGPGTETYSIFGHSAIRIYDPLNHINVTYNYGTFDFSTDYFYLKFIRGNLNYFLTINDFKRTIPFYIAENRSINEAELNFSLKQKQKIYDLLTENYKPENRFYKYDFFFDNCATRIRDILIETVDDDYEFSKNNFLEVTSFRKLLSTYISGSPWLDLGINLALGLPADQPAGVYGSMYLPDYLKEGFANAYIVKNKSKVAYINSQNDIFKSKPNQIKKSIFIQVTSPFVLFNIVLIVCLILSYLEYKSKINNVIFDKILFGIIGLLGFVIFLLWFATEHAVMENNLNILWAFPLHLIYIFTINKTRFRRINFYYLMIYGIILFALLLSWSFFPQNFHNSLIPLVIALLARSIMKAFKLWQIKRSAQVQ